MTISYKNIFIFVAISGLFFAGSFTANATVVCNGLVGTITSSPDGGAPATASVTNNSNYCTGQVTFSSYKVYVPYGNPGWLDTQVLFDYQTLNLAPGETKVFTINTPSCAGQLDVYEGPVQPNLSDAAGGFPGQNLLTAAFTNTSNICTNTTPLTCSPANQSVNVNQIADFSANGGTGHYNWSGGGSPATGSAAGFSTSYSSSGTRTVTVTDGSQTANCSVTVNQPIPPIVCSPSNQTVNTGDIAAFSAQGGNGNYSWTGGGSPSTGTGTNFSTAYSTSGTKTVTVTDGVRSATCNVTVNQPVQTLTCAPQNQTINVGDIAVFSANGGSGSYNWTSPGTPASGVGTNFSSAFSTSGTKTVTVTDGSQTANCSVTVNQPVQALACAPQNQTVNVGDIAVFSATGGTGSYTWTSPGAPASGVGTNFSSAFSSPGTKTVTVTDGTQTGQCSVTVNQPTQTLTCAPSNQNGNINDYLTFSATGGSGSYNWSASDGNPTTGGGSTFTTQFSTSGNKTITVTSGSQTATCSASINQPVCNQPVAYLNAATNVNDTSATLNGYVDPQGKSATYYFEYGTSQSYGQTTNVMTISSAANVLFPLYGLQPNTTYYYRLVIQTSCGVTRSGNFSFTTGNQNPPQQQISCNPQNQNVNVGDWVNFGATGGNGNYYWSTSGDASPYSGNGSNFGTRFSNNGTKIVTVSSSGGGSAQCIVYINTQQYSNFQITKNVLDRTLGQSSYVNNVEAQAQDMLEFEIRVQVNGANYGNPQILLRDALPYGLTYVSGSTHVNGNQVPDGLIQSSGIYLNNNYGQEQVIRFLATVDQNRTGGSLTNQAFVTINSDTRSAYATVTIRPRGTVLGAADVVTGPEDVLPIAMTLGFAFALIAYYFMFYRKSASLKFNFASDIAVAEVPTTAPKKKTEFEKMLERIRSEEKAPDA